MIDDDRITLTDSTRAAMERIATAPATAARSALGQPGLSPAAQAVLSAFRAVPDLRDCPSIAAALRAAADQVVPQGGPFLMTASEDRVRHQLLAIAAELERQPDA